MDAPIAIANLMMKGICKGYEMQAKKEEKEANAIITGIDPVLLQALCTSYDNEMGEYPVHLHEGEAVFKFYKELKKGAEPKSKEKLLISHWDEWYAPSYACPFCGDTNILDIFVFCPHCGRSLNWFVFETEGEVCKRINKKKNE